MSGILPAFAGNVMSDLIGGPLVGMVNKLAGRSYISLEDRAGLFELPYTSRLLDAGRYLVREGDSPDHCHILVSGLTCRHKITGDGLRQIVAINVPGDVVDLQMLYLKIADHSVQTLGQCEVLTVPRDAIRKLTAERPSVAHAIFATILVDASIASEWILNIGRRNARTRIAHLLCELAARIDRPGISPGQTYKLPMTQEQVGDAVGLTAVHVNRMLQGLSKDGLIYYSKQTIIIPNWAKLSDVADFNGRYLHKTI